MFEKLKKTFSKNCPSIFYEYVLDIAKEDESDGELTDISSVSEMPVENKTMPLLVQPSTDTQFILDNSKAVPDEIVLHKKERNDIKVRYAFVMKNILFSVSN